VSLQALLGKQPEAVMPLINSSSCYICTTCLACCTRHRLWYANSAAAAASALSRQLHLQVYSSEQREIEQQLAVVTGKLKMQHFCQEQMFYNVLSYKQIAVAHISAWPFVPDALSGEQGG
jgi:Fe-S-cluster-containing hydrogenase component 2